MTNSNQNLSLFSILILVSLSSHLLIPIATYTPPDNIALNCGDYGDSVAQGGRKWTGDVSSKYLPTQQPNNTSSTSIAPTQDSAPQIPYMTARIFRSQFTYTFNVATLGQKFIRFHFHPANYPTLNMSNTYFAVAVNNFTLLRNFSTLLAARYLNTTYFVKEFCINLVSERILNVTFIPSPGSFAFVNAIEVVSMPTNLYISGKSVRFADQSQPLIIDNSTALEMVYRLNVGGSVISPEKDTGMYRGWSQDIDYIYGAARGVYPYNWGINIKYTKVQPYTAPEILYRTARTMGKNATVNENYNLTWIFSVDSGFFYLVRLHFCEITPSATGSNQRVFEIFLNNRTADDQMDIWDYAGGIGVPIYREFMVMVPGTGSKIDLWLALHPNTRAQAGYSDALLNGLEIFKLNNSDGSLAGLNPKFNLPDPILTRKSEHHIEIKIVIIIVGVIICGVFVLSISFLLIFRKRQQDSSGSSNGSCFGSPFLQSNSHTTKTESLPSDLCRQFSLAEIKSATNDFSEALLIGVGGFGNVYKGYINGGSTPVAIKRLNPNSQQGAHEFRTEIVLLSQLRHLHLVSLIGYCEDHNEMILVYDYMARGTLRDHLYGSNNPPLPWKMRLQICIGAARGLHYLHTGAKYTIIHRDVKTTNILLDENWTAKVSDFGLSKMGPTSMSQTHVSTDVKGSLGYLDPEYFRRQQLTEKSDVYSFGVVLFEVLCGRPPVDIKLGRGETCLSEWARAHYRKGKLDQIIDPYLKGKIDSGCLRKLGEVADNCLQDQGIERPTMNDVVWNLEFALQLQESSDEGGASKQKDGEECQLYSSYPVTGISGDARTDNFSSNAILGLSGSVFSEIKNIEGR